MRKAEKELVYSILKNIVTTPLSTLESSVPFLDGLMVRRPVIDLTNEQMKLVANALNELGPEGENWKIADGDA